MLPERLHLCRMLTKCITEIQTIYNINNYTNYYHILNSIYILYLNRVKYKTDKNKYTYYISGK